MTALPRTHTCARGGADGIGARVEPARDNNARAARGGNFWPMSLKHYHPFPFLPSLPHPGRRRRRRLRQSKTPPLRCAHLPAENVVVDMTVGTNDEHGILVERQRLPRDTERLGVMATWQRRRQAFLRWALNDKTTNGVARTVNFMARAAWPAAWQAAHAARRVALRAHACARGAHHSDATRTRFYLLPPPWVTRGGARAHSAGTAPSAEVLYS